MKKLLLFVFALAIAVPATAQTIVTPNHRIAWDQDSVDSGGVFTWETSIDGINAFAPVLGVTCTGTPTASCSGALPQSLTTGRHTLALRTVRTLDGNRYISAEPYPTITFDFLSNVTPPSPRNFRPTLPPNAANVAVSGNVLYRGSAFGQDVATNSLDGIPNFPFYFGASSLNTGGAYGGPQTGDKFYLVLWRP